MKSRRIGFTAKAAAILAWAFLAQAILAAPAPAAAAAGEALRFERVFPSFGSDREAEDALKADPMRRETALLAANHYWMSAMSGNASAQAKRAACAKAVDILEPVWKQNKRDDEVCLSLGYAYMSLAGTIPMSELEALLSNINKAQNLFGMIVARLPRNMDARLARTLINMNLTAQNGRPDALVLEDVDVYLEGYGAMGQDLRANGYYYMGAMEMRLARALVYHDQGKKAAAKATLAEIDEAVLAQQFKNLLAPLKKAYGR